MMPSLPWYTLVAVGLVILFVVGVWLTLARLVISACWVVMMSSWVWLWTAVSRLCGATPASAGTAHFASTRELHRAGVFNATGLPLGTWKDGQTIREPRGSHVAVIAPPRSGKSWGLVMPILREYQGSCIVTDLRGELHQHTAQAREAYGPVYKFDPTSTGSCALNVLDAVRWNTAAAFSDVDRIAHHVLAPSGNAIEDGFRRNAIPLLRAIIFDRYSAGMANFPAVLAWMTDPTRSITEKLERLLNESPDPYVQRGARNAMNMSVKLRQGVWSSLVETLGIFEDPTIAENTRKSDCFLDDLLHGPEPLTIYLTMPFHEITRLGRYLGLFIESIVSLVSAPHAPARHPLLMCLDEMSNLGKLTELEKAVSYLQGAGCQCLFVFQNMSQILDVYGATSPLLSSLSTTVFYTPVPTDMTTATLISKALGQATITTLATQHDGVRLLGGSITSQTQAERGRPLLTPDEVTRLDKTTALILTQEHPPIYATKLGGTPAPWHVRACDSLVRHPGLAASVAACLLLAASLWPLGKALAPAFEHPVLAHMQEPPVAWGSMGIPPASMPPPAPAQTEQPLTPPHPGWVLKARMPGLGPLPLALRQGTFSTAEACDAALAARWEPTIQREQQQHGRFGKHVQVTRTPHRLAWTVASAGLGVEEHVVWCEEQAAAPQP